MDHAYLCPGCHLAAVLLVPSADGGRAAEPPDRRFPRADNKP